MIRKWDPFSDQNGHRKGTKQHQEVEPEINQTFTKNPAKKQKSVADVQYVFGPSLSSKKGP